MDKVSGSWISYLKSIPFRIIEGIHFFMGKWMNLLADIYDQYPHNITGQTVLYCLSSVIVFPLILLYVIICIWRFIDERYPLVSWILIFSALCLAVLFLGYCIKSLGHRKQPE